MSNFRSAAAQIRAAEQIYRRCFDAAPLPFLVLTPDFRIINANDAYLAAVGRKRESLAGIDMFDALPDNPHDRGANGVSKLRSSFAQVLRTGKSHVMPRQRYDIRPDDRPWEVRYWNPANWVCVDEAGLVFALVHHVIDATAQTVPAARSALAAGDEIIARTDAAIRAAQQNAADVRWGVEQATKRSCQLLAAADCLREMRRQEMTQLKSDNEVLVERSRALLARSGRQLRAVTDSACNGRVGPLDGKPPLSRNS